MRATAHLTTTVAIVLAVGPVATAHAAAPTWSAPRVARPAPAARATIPGGGAIEVRGRELVERRPGRATRRWPLPVAISELEVALAVGKRGDAALTWWANETCGDGADGARTVECNPIVGLSRWTIGRSTPDAGDLVLDRRRIAAPDPSAADTLESVQDVHVAVAADGTATVVWTLGELFATPTHFAAAVARVGAHAVPVTHLPRRGVPRSLEAGRAAARLTWIETNRVRAATIGPEGAGPARTVAYARGAVDPAFHRNARGDRVISWTRTGERRGPRVVVRLAPAGRRFGPAIAVGRAVNHRLALGPDGDVAVALDDDGHDDGRRHRVHVRRGTVTGGFSRPSRPVGSLAAYPFSGIAVGADGATTVVVATGQHLAALHAASRDDPLGPPTTLAAGACSLVRVAVRAARWHCAGQRADRVATLAPATPRRVR